MPPDPSTEAVPPDARDTSDEIIVDYTDLPRGREMKEAAAIAFAASRPVRLVVIAGQVKGGKTTLLTSLYEMFQAGPVSGQNFAGSVTLAGLEDRCHSARTASNNETSKTKRTPYKGPDPFYLHLKTALIGTPLEATDFLFTDVSGEMFEHAIDTVQECKELTFLMRANHFVLLLDGEKAVRQEKWAMVQNARTLLKSCIDCGMLPSFCPVAVVWSKFDYFDAAPAGEQAAHEKFREDVEKDFTTNFAHRVHSLKFARIAARPERSPALGFGHGVTDLFTDWHSVSPRSSPMNLVPKQAPGSRQSERFVIANPTAPAQ